MLDPWVGSEAMDPAQPDPSASLEKIKAIRLSYISQVTDLLDIDQMGGRKQRSATDAVITLTHDIELAKNQGNTLSCLMLDVKGAFDHISIY